MDLSVKQDGISLAEYLLKSMVEGTSDLLESEVLCENQVYEKLRRVTVAQINGDQRARHSWRRLSWFWGVTSGVSAKASGWRSITCPNAVRVSADDRGWRVNQGRSAQRWLAQVQNR